VVDPMTRKLPVEVELRDPEARLRPGLVARLRVETGPPRQALTVDENAVFERFRQSFVFVVQQGKAARREVMPGELRDGRIEILSGLQSGEQVVIAGIDRVSAGAAVSVVEARVEQYNATAEHGERQAAVVNAATEEARAEAAQAEAPEAQATAP
jgi:membrane fusion protein, multidrug efflux system